MKFTTTSKWVFTMFTKSNLVFVVLYPLFRWNIKGGITNKFLQKQSPNAVFRNSPHWATRSFFMNSLIMSSLAWLRNLSFSRFWPPSSKKLKKCFPEKSLNDQNSLFHLQKIKFDLVIAEYSAFKSNFKFFYSTVNSASLCFHMSLLVVKLVLYEIEFCRF